MKRKGSIIANQIIEQWTFERELRSIYEAKQRKQEEEKQKEEQNSIK